MKTTWMFPRSFGEFEAFIRGIDWPYYLEEGSKVKVRSYSYASKLYHEGKLDRIARGILAELGYSDKDFQSILRIEQRENRSTAYLALTPEPMFRRRYKSDFSHPAPLQEHLAASAIRWAQIDERPDYIHVPFAGSGTLVMESWLSFHRPALDLWRNFTCIEGLPEFPVSTWTFIKNRLNQLDAKVIPARAVEIDKGGIEVLKKNLDHAAIAWPGIAGEWEAIGADFLKDKCPLDKKTIFLPLNPPYGLRLEEDTQDLYRRTGAWLKNGFAADQRRYGFILVADSRSFHAFEKEVGAENIRGIQSFTQGGQHIRCVKFDIPRTV